PFGAKMCRLVVLIDIFASGHNLDVCQGDFFARWCCFSKAEGIVRAREEAGQKRVLIGDEVDQD
ncbi:MAG TPA: hypothetical protein VGE39_08335, partial [Prosthecobacter sp.]